MRCIRRQRWGMQPCSRIPTGSKAVPYLPLAGGTTGTRRGGLGTCWPTHCSFELLKYWWRLGAWEEWLHGMERERVCRVKGYNDNDLLIHES